VKRSPTAVYVLVPALAIASVALTACGGDKNRSDQTTTPTTPTGTQTTQQNPAPKTGAAKFSGRARKTYFRAPRRCAASSPSRVARRYGAISSDPVDAAVAYSERVYRARFREAALEGCLAGF